MESDVICISIQAYLDCIKLNPTLLRKEGGKSSLLLTHPPRATLNRHEGFSHRIKRGDRHSLCFVTLAFGGKTAGSRLGRSYRITQSSSAPSRTSAGERRHKAAAPTAGLSLGSRSILRQRQLQFPAQPRLLIPIPVRMPGREFRHMRSIYFTSKEESGSLESVTSLATPTKSNRACESETSVRTLGITADPRKQLSRKHQGKITEAGRRTQLAISRGIH